jgi:hypothetical protein
MVGEVSLSAATRTNLLALQRTTQAIEITQKRLSTGLRVNSAIDDSVAFFQPLPSPTAQPIFRFSKTILTKLSAVPKPL